MTDLVDYSAQEVAKWIADNYSPASHGDLSVELEDDTGTVQFTSAWPTTDINLDTSVSGEVTIENTADISFGSPSASHTLTDVNLTDGSGNTLASYALDSSKSVSADTDELLIQSGNLTFKVQ